MKYLMPLFRGVQNEKLIIFISFCKGNLNINKREKNVRKPTTLNEFY